MMIWMKRWTRHRAAKRHHYRAHMHNELYRADPDHMGSRWVLRFPHKHCSWCIDILEKRERERVQAAKRSAARQRRRDQDREAAKELEEARR